MKNIKSKLPILSGIIYSSIFGFSFMFTKKGLNVLEPMQLLGFRFAAAALLLSLLKFLGFISVNIKGKRIHLLLLLALFQPVAYFVFEVLGVKLTSSSEAGMMIALIPVLVAVLAAFLLNEKPTNVQWFFILLSVLGVVFINLMKGMAQINGSTLGIIFLIGAVVSASLFNILSRKSSMHFSPVEITYVMMWVGAIVFNIIATIQSALDGGISFYFKALGNIEALISILYLGWLSSVIAFLLVNYTLSKIEASRSAVFANFTTVVSIIAGVVILGESFYWFHFIGCFMILFGVWGTNYFTRKEKLKHVN